MTLTLRAAAIKDRNATKAVDFQHRHFAAIAATIRDLDLIDGMDRSIIAHGFARDLAKTNPKFDRTRFLCACIPTGE